MSILQPKDDLESSIGVSVSVFAAEKWALKYAIVISESVDASR